jgi:conjugative transposon TraM protein
MQWTIKWIKMEMQITTRERRERDFLLRAPLAALPLLTLLFWAFGGGGSPAAKEVAKGFNMRLPGPDLRRAGNPDKLAYYEKAARDSVAARQREKLEQNYARQLGLADSAAGTPEQHMRQVQEKLAEVRRVMAGAVGATGAPPAMAAGAAKLGSVAGNASRPASARPFPVEKHAPEMDKLERIMGALKRNEESNPELAQLSQVLTQLTEVQRPRVEGRKDGAGTDAARNSSALSSVSRQVMPVRALPDEDDTTGAIDSNAISAIVADGQTLVSGGELRLELGRDIMIGRPSAAGGLPQAMQLIPHGTPVYGVAQLTGERLRVMVTAIQYNERIFPVSLQVDGEDGLPGIYIPGAPASDALHESAEQETGTLGPTVLSTTLAGQAAGAGLALARSLAGKKLRPVKVTVPAGYRVILHITNTGL